MKKTEKNDQIKEEKKWILLYSLKIFIHSSSTCLTFPTPQQHPCMRTWTPGSWVPWQHFCSVQPGQAHLPGIPLRTTARSLRRFASIHKRSLYLRWSQCGNSVQELGVLSGLLPNFPELQALAIPSSHWEGGHWIPSAWLLVSRGTISEQSLLSRTIIAWCCFTPVSFPHPMKPLLLPSHKKGKASLENLQWRAVDKDYVKLKNGLCATIERKAQLHSSYPLLSTHCYPQALWCFPCFCNYPPRFPLRPGCLLRLAHDKGPPKPTETLPTYPTAPFQVFPRSNLRIPEHLRTSCFYKTIPTHPTASLSQAETI